MLVVFYSLLAEVTHCGEPCGWFLGVVAIVGCGLWIDWMYTACIVDRFKRLTAQMEAYLL